MVGSTQSACGCSGGSPNLSGNVNSGCGCGGSLGPASPQSMSPMGNPLSDGGSTSEAKTMNEMMGVNKPPSASDDNLYSSLAIGALVIGGGLVAYGYNR